MTQEGLFRDLKVFIAKTFDEKFEEKFDKMFDGKFEEKFDNMFDEKLEGKLENMFDKKFEEKFSGVTQVFQAEFNDVRYKMADMQADLTRIDQKIDGHTSILRKDIVSIKKMLSEDMIAFGKNVVHHEKRITTLEKLQS